MMQRLLEGELRMDSITDSATAARARTQASNFSLCRRSAAFVVIGTVSTLNWRKHSDKSARYGSFKPTNAARAAVLRRMGRGARVAAKALFISLGTTPLSKHIVKSGADGGNNPKGQHAGY